MIKINFSVSVDGYLMRHTDWKAQWAESKAVEHQLVLAAFDWRVLAFVREFYDMNGVMPLTRRIISFIREALDPNMDSMGLQARYSDKPLRVIALLAGLPKPIQCL